MIASHWTRHFGAGLSGRGWPRPPEASAPARSRLGPAADPPGEAPGDHPDPEIGDQPDPENGRLLGRPRGPAPGP
ncbi:MAG: hypothetical protein AVDCRST_MAG49-1299 [uncultured Thermomicrobiales bacterium]|uniref:Uncharacterized protein n=1 Tax=uncultured Thermomicrobiales bacterium TaxID=1645740 RepID=A0A6J4U974_9BACT|nr:MAG: hypothetical protein AVDCRST_MAG49-1299 [uncultured Thermomicrobiales bacterium]